MKSNGKGKVAFSGSDVVGPLTTDIHQGMSLSHDMILLVLDTEFFHNVNVKQHHVSNVSNIYLLCKFRIFHSFIHSLYVSSCVQKMAEYLEAGNNNPVLVRALISGGEHPEAMQTSSCHKQFEKDHYIRVISLMIIVFLYNHNIHPWPTIAVVSKLYNVCHKQSQLCTRLFIKTKS